MKKNVIYYIRKNIFIVLMLISLCPVLAISYAKFTINSESYRSNEMYISELLYSVKIDNENTYTIDIEPGETEHTIEITSLSGISTNYKLAYLNNDNLVVKYASDYMDASFGGIVMTRTISLTVKNTSTTNQTLSLSVFGGYSFNDVNNLEILNTYTEIDTNYLHYDYETTALYVDNTRVDELDSSKKYNLLSYTCSNDATVTYDSDNSIINVKTYKQTKCSLYFEEIKAVTLANYLINNHSTLGLTKISQSATGNQNYATTEYRYQGASPNNYIIFNDETGVWRIIGVFEVQTPNGSGYTTEYKVKIVKNRSGSSKWDTTADNDWTTATLMTLLNSGDYYNRTGTYASNGLTDTAKSQISSTKWYLGNVTENTTTDVMYAAERSTSVHSGNSQTWDGKVALIYPSDYMYASSTCYNNGTTGYNYNTSACTSTDWLYSGSWYWTISPDSGFVDSALILTDYGYLGSSSVCCVVEVSDVGIRPSVYLSSSVNYIDGSGTTSDPFIIN